MTLASVRDKIVTAMDRSEEHGPFDSETRWSGGRTVMQYASKTGAIIEYGQVSEFTRSGKMER